MEKLGFPWILSSESSLFNGLRGIFAERNFSRPFSSGGGSTGPGASGLGIAKRKILHRTSFNLVSDFLQQIALDVSPFGLVDKLDFQGAAGALTAGWRRGRRAGRGDDDRVLITFPWINANGPSAM